MASRIVEFFGYSPNDLSPPALLARQNLACPILGKQCIKKLSDGLVSGVCTLAQQHSGPVICCPIRLYSGNYEVLRDVANVAFGPDIPLAPADAIGGRTGEFIAVFGKGWGKELRLPNRGRSGGYFVDWVLALVNASGTLVDFVAVEVQSIDTTGNYRHEREAHLEAKPFPGKSTAGFNWENVNKRILPQLIYKGHVLRQEPLCRKGLFFVCPTPVQRKIVERLGGALRPYPIQPGSLTMLWYDVAPEAVDGQMRPLIPGGRLTTTIDQVALAFTAPSNLPPAKVYEDAIRAALEHR